MERVSDLAIMLNYGFLGVFFLFVVFTTWKCGRWFGKEILVPLKDTHFAFLASMQTNMKGMNDAVNSQADTMQELANAQQRSNEILQKQASTLEAFAILLQNKQEKK